VNLTIKERILLPSLFPQRSNKLTLIVCENIEEKVVFSTEEVEKYGITAIPNGWKWDDQFDGEICSIEFSEEEISVLKDQSQRLDREKGITRPVLSLIRKIDAL
jgi:hypothetical protein